MSWSERFVRHHRRQTDCAIHSAYRRLASDPLALQKFHELLCRSRQRATRLFEAPVVNGLHLGIDALVNLSRFHGSHLRRAIDWPGTSSSWRTAVALLAHHLVSKYKVPAFLASAWYANDPTADTKRGWFIAHSWGASFRSLNLPIAMTRKMERIFLASEDHLQIEPAMRRAELVALGAPPEFVKAILSTSLATDLRHDKFWRTFWIFLVTNAEDVDPVQIEPMIDYIQTVRHDRIIIQTQDGRTEFDPPLPAFSMKGRTVQSIQRLMHAWHRSLGVSSTGLSWMRSPFQPWLFEESGGDGSETPRRWHMMELTNSAQLRSEGAALHHCVASYAGRCRLGTSSIWSLRVWQGERIDHMLTVEVNPRRRTVVQARGRANRAAAGKPLRLLQDWAVRERLQMAI